jgi:hypothetical protein
MGGGVWCEATVTCEETKVPSKVGFGRAHWNSPTDNVTHTNPQKLEAYENRCIRMCHSDSSNGARSHTKLELTEA